MFDKEGVKCLMKCLMCSTGDREDLSDIEVSIQWRCQSPVRPHHKRKNWFVDVSIIDEVEEISREADIEQGGCPAPSA